MMNLQSKKIEKLLSFKTKVHIYDCVKSTNDVAFERGGIVFALTQTGGRGRSGRKFYSGEGGLYFSMSLKTEGDEVMLGEVRRPFSAGRLTIAAGIAVAKALRSYGFDARIKWVNDVFVLGKKVCGILAERRGDIVVLGIGVNVNSSIPNDLENVAASLNLQTDLCELAARIINGFYLEFASPDIDFANEYTLTIGKTVRYGDRLGSAVGIDQDGALKVKFGDRVERLMYGEACTLD